MRKSSKLLAVLLTLCLMFGAITAIFASANTETTDPFNVTGREDNDYQETLQFHNVGGTTKYYYLYGSNALVTKDPNCALSIKEGDALSGVTVDFDIDTTKLADTNTITVRCRLAKILEGSETFGSGGAKFLELASLYIKKIDGVPHLVNNTTATSGIVLSENAHYTNVIYADYNANNELTYYQKIFVNGEPCFNLKTTPTDAITYSRFAAVYIAGFVAGTDVETADSITLNNIAVNHYAKADTTLNPYKVDGLPTANIYDAEKVVYNTSYNKNALGIEDKYVEFSTGEKIYLPAVSLLTKKMTNDCTLTVKGMSFNNVEIPETITKFSVKLENGGIFTLSNESQSRFDVKEEGGVYVYTYEKKAMVETEDCNGTGSYVLNTTGHKDATKVGFEYNNSAKSPFIKVSYETSYVRIHYDNGNGLYGETPVEFKPGNADGGKYHEREAEIVWRAYGYYNADTDLKNFKYFTIDFDFAADRYAYTFTDGDKTYYATGKDVAEAKANLENEQGVTLNSGYTVSEPVLAYPTNLAFKSQLQTSKDGITEAPTAAFTVSSKNDHWQYTNGGDIKVRNIGGDWYVTNPAVNETVKISSELGVFNHVTYVYELSVVDGVFNAIPHIYVNGEYAFTLAAAKGVGSFDHFQQLMIDFYANNSTTFGDKMYDKYSLAFDNISLSYYAADALESTTLDESMATKAPLYTLKGVIYNEDYVTPNTDRYATVEGVNKKYYVINAPFYNAEGKTITLHNAKYTYSGNHNSFTVLFEGASDFAMTSDIAWRYAKTPEGTYIKVFDGQVLTNLSLTANRFETHIYLPIRTDLAKDCISFVKAYTPTGGDDVNFSADYNFFLEYKGVTYYAITWNARTDMTNPKSANFELNYNVGEDSYGFVANFSGVFDPIKYMNLAAAAAECGSEEAQLIKAMMDYKVGVLNYIKHDAGTSDYDAKTAIPAIAEFYAIYEAHTDCTCGTYVREDADLAEKYINVGEAHTDLPSKDLVDVTFGLDADNRYFFMYLKSSAYTVFEIRYKNIKNVELVKEVVADADGYAALLGIKVTDIDNEFTIVGYKGTYDEGTKTVTKTDEVTVAEFEYSLADYNVNTDAVTATLVQAIKDLAVVAENYKKYIKTPAN